MVIIPLLSAAAFELLFPVFLAVNRRLRASFQPPDTINVYIVGESTAAGWPYQPKISFPKVLLHMYEGRLAGKRLRLINLAEPGSCLEQQYWSLFRELTLRPPVSGLLLVYSGLNETFMGTGGEAPLLLKLEQKSFILSKLSSFSSSSGLLSAVFGPFYSSARYGSRLERTIRLARRNGLKTVVSTLTCNFSDFPPSTRPYFPDKNGAAVFEYARRREASGHFKEAASAYSRLLAGSKGNSALNFRLGKCLAEAGNFRGAAENFRLAVEDGTGKRPTRMQNGIIRQAAASEGASLAETEELFERASPHGLVGYNLFVDVHHPNIAGQVLLARSFSKEIAELYGEVPARPAPTVEEIFSFTGFTDADSLKANILQIVWLAAEMAVTDSTELIPKAKEYLAKAERLWRKIGRAPEFELELYRCRLIMAAVQQDSRGVIRCLEEADFLGRNIGFIKTGRAEYNTWVVSLVLKKVSLPENIRKMLAMPPPAAQPADRKRGRRF